jgi:hypothetical protein
MTIETAATVNVVLHIQPGIGQGGDTAPPENPAQNEKGWLRAMSKGSKGEWDDPSHWWFCYSGGNGKDAHKGGIDGGEVVLPTGGSFSICPSGNEIINRVDIHETATLPPGVTSYYNPNPPIVGEGGCYAICDTEHEDPKGCTDSFDVYAQFNSGGTEVKCDPIIRNRT